MVALTPSRMPHQCAWVSSGRELSHLFEKTYLTGEEGLVVKDPLSRWLPDDRSGLWAKIKPENQGNTYDYDVVVLAGAYGSKQGSRGELTQFMVGVLERDGADGSGEKPRFLTYCRVANGLDTDDRCGEGVSRADVSMHRRSLGSRCTCVPRLPWGGT